MNDTVKTVTCVIIDLSKRPTNVFGPEAWETHIKCVDYFAHAFAIVLEADLRVCRLAALTHDIASLTNLNFYQDHHIHGQDLAKQLLRNLKCPHNEIKHILHCIHCHRGNQKQERNTLEAHIVASADALSHIVYFPAILRLAICVHKMPLAEAVIWSREKIMKSWEKLLPIASNYAYSPYTAILEATNEDWI